MERGGEGEREREGERGREGEWDDDERDKECEKKVREDVHVCIHYDTTQKYASLN